MICGKVLPVILGLLQLSCISRSVSPADSAPPVSGLKLEWTEETPLPLAVSNNAVASLPLKGKMFLFSFMGIDESRSSAGITRRSFRYDTSERVWTEIDPVPGVKGRLGATAQAAQGKIYIIGGYTVGARLGETSLPNVDIYDPVTDSYSTGSGVPVPVDDSLSVQWRDRLIFLVSGWSRDGNVRAVQFFDPRRNRWGQATAIPGPPVFGHAGGIIGDTIVYCGGVKIDLRNEARYVASSHCFRGDIDPDDPSRIVWRRIPDHPGGSKYRAAAVGDPVSGRIVFTGGTDNPYNYNGIGYDGRPSRPSADTFLYDPVSNTWEMGPLNMLPTMDHRGLVGSGSHFYLIGGMTSGQLVNGRVERLTLTGDVKP